MTNEELIEALGFAMIDADPLPMQMFDRGEILELVRAILTRLRDLGPSEEMARDHQAAAFELASNVVLSARGSLNAMLTSLLGDPK